MLIAIGLLGGCSHKTEAASYDCTKAVGKAEILICNDKKLSELDEMLDATFREIYAFIADPAGLRLEQRQWLKSRNNCSTESCLVKIYEKRILTFNNIKNKPKPCFQLLERNYPEVKSGHYPVCVDFVNNLNQFCSQPPPTCKREVDPKYKILALLKWKELDPKKYLNVIAQILTSNYQFRKKWRPLPEKMKEKIMMGKTKLLHAWVDLDNDGVKENVIRFDAGDCIAENPSGKKGFYGFNYRISVVDKDISKVDKRFEYLHRNIIDIILHEKRTFLLSRQTASNDELLLKEAFFEPVTKARNAKSICVFSYTKTRN